ncbi:hypothetical protein B0H19DRAFT_525980 [Mycena capillaripes]|nr:hypothetical protein B0H19DRAFT_525980 [Mycena capillaripes]
MRKVPSCAAMPSHLWMFYPVHRPPHLVVVQTPPIPRSAPLHAPATYTTARRPPPRRHAPTYYGYCRRTSLASPPMRRPSHAPRSCICAIARSTPPASPLVSTPATPVTPTLWRRSAARSRIDANSANLFAPSTPLHPMLTLTRLE